MGPREINRLLVPTGKASTQLTDHLITGWLGLSLPRKSGSSQTIRTYKPYLLSWVVIFEVLPGCHYRHPNFG